MIPTPEQAEIFRRNTELSELADQVAQLMKRHRLTEDEVTHVVRDVLVAMTPRVESFVDRVKSMTRPTAGRTWQATLTPTGGVTLPSEIRQHLGLLPGDSVALQVQTDGTTVVRKAVPKTGQLVLALDLEATLISSAVSQFPRPMLFEFLEHCRALFARIVMFTTIREERFRVIAKTLVDEGSAPSWFQQLECVAWTGPTKDLRFIPNCAPEDAVLVDDLASYVHPGQEERWVQVEPFEPPFNGSDRALEKVLDELEERVRRQSHS